MIATRERFYPLGTAVRLKGNSDIFVIIGLKPQSQNGGAVDYLAVRYPCGYECSPNSQYAFNAEAVAQVLADGYRDENFEKLSEHLEEFEKLTSANPIPTPQHKPILD